MTSDLLTDRALNRATLARQNLLDRAQLSATATIEHLVGLQGQAPDAPYVGLWSRLADFDPGELADLITGRHAVRVPLMRGTVHLVTADDCLALRPVMQRVLEAGFASQQFARNLAGTDLTAILAAGRAILDERPRTRVELGRLLELQWPGRDPVSLAYAISYLVPTVQVPPRAVWGQTALPTFATVETWIGRPWKPMTPDELVLRYLAAYGPASVKDVQRWSGLTRLSEVAERLLPRLRTFRDERGGQLYDLPDAPRPEPDIPAPPRFLPEYDNVLLSHEDRSRINPDNHPIPIPPGNGARTGTLLLDGRFAATWKITREHSAATMHITALGNVPERDAVAQEGRDLLAFAVPGADDYAVRFEPR